MKERIKSIKLDGLSRAYKFSYDNGGNILKKETYYITNGTISTTPTKTDIYEYETVAEGCGQNSAWKDQLKSYNGTAITYDESGNPLNYLGKVLTWQGRRLTSIDGVALEYDYNGLRVKKGDRNYYWQSGNLAMERWVKNGTENYIYYYYDESGVCGMNYNGTEYYYRKNIFGDVLAIYDSLGNLQCKYVYDAWGNHKVYNASGSEIGAEVINIGNINSIRYRGYYWDKEFGLYYLQSRYYDSMLGRFVSADGISYLDPESIVGFNLYAYCGGNPIMYADPEGKFFLSLLFTAVVGAGIAALSSTVVQLATTGEVDLKQVAVSAAFGAVGSALAFTGIGGVFGQFAIQGLLGVGETYSIAALNNTISSLTTEEIFFTFLFSGTLGAIGAKGAAKEFNRIGQIEASFIKYTKRDISRYGSPIVETILKRGAKYIKEFIQPTLKSSAVSGGISAISNVASHYAQVLMEYIG